MLTAQLGRSVCIRWAGASLTRFTRPCITSKARWNSTAAPDGPAVSETNRAEATMKRFWKDVGLEKRGSSLAITLDGRALKTPAGNTLTLPETKSVLASLIAAEWDFQETLLKPHALPAVRVEDISSFLTC
ncbi:hypothetical protein DXG03_001094 [Asterophora parasitica]|uniref:Uncharacterized protein n=1 Tax=Asterophora parasitica TaxID=117018 RepID=A0A9P7GAW9_9AGAR|nr:hypothetical protein DXG03_001094 [Asterophora parasitica]